MKIVFFPINDCEFNPNSLDERPLGGTETAIIRLSEALQELGQQVFIISQKESNLPGKPVYVKPTQLKNLSLDALIVNRDWRGAFHPFTTRKCFYWTGDDSQLIYSVGLGDKRVMGKIDAFFAVSEWQANNMCKVSGFPREKTYVLRNGIHSPYFEHPIPRNRKRLIYSSHPQRGLIHLPLIYIELKMKHPDLELHIFSSDSIYAKEWDETKQKNTLEPGIGPYSIIGDILRKLPDCHLHGSVLQKQLAQEFLKSAILVYPTDFRETSCITAMEAQAAGCAIVTTDLAALKETVGQAGILIDDMPEEETYRPKFVEACDRLLSDDAYFNQLSSIGKKQAQQYSWKNRAQGLLKYLAEKHGLE